MVDVKAKSTIFSLIALIGAIIGIVGIFMAWISVDLFLSTYSVSGWEIITESLEARDFSLDGYVQWTPLVVLVFSVIGLLTALMGVARPGKPGGVGTLVCGIFVLIGAILFMTYSNDGISMSDFLGVGVYLALVSGILLLIFGALMSSSKATA